MKGNTFVQKLQKQQKKFYHIWEDSYFTGGGWSAQAQM